MPDEMPLRVRMAIASDRWFRRVIGGLTAALSGLWLGILDSAHLAMKTTAAYDDEDTFSSDDHNLAGLWTWEREVVDRHFPNGARVLVPCAGGGREVLALQDLGYEVVGFDPSSALIEAGQRLLGDRGSQAQLLLSPPDALPDNLDGDFQAVLVGWGGYTHIRGREDRIAFLSALRYRVDEGSPLLISFFIRTAERRRFRLTRFIANAIRRLRRSPHRVQLGDTLGGTFDHFFTWDEITDELAQGGFAVIASAKAPFAHAVCHAV